MDHPSETFLNELESHLMIQVFSNTQIIISSCISSLAAVVNKITKNYKLIRDCFKKYDCRMLTREKGFDSMFLVCFQVLPWQFSSKSEKVRI